MLPESKSKVRKPRKLDPEKLREYIKNYPDETLAGRGAAFGANRWVHSGTPGEGGKSIFEDRLDRYACSEILDQENISLSEWISG
jgi:hypothetical protein